VQSAQTEAHQPGKPALWAPAGHSVTQTLMVHLRSPSTRRKVIQSHAQHPAEAMHTSLWSGVGLLSQRGLLSNPNNCKHSLSRHPLCPEFCRECHTTLNALVSFTAEPFVSCFEVCPCPSLLSCSGAPSSMGSQTLHVQPHGHEAF